MAHRPLDPPPPWIGARLAADMEDRTAQLKV